MGSFLECSIARRKILCVSGKVVIWSTHWGIRMEAQCVWSVVVSCLPLPLPHPLACPLIVFRYCAASLVKIKMTYSPADIVECPSVWPKLKLFHI